MRRKKSSALIVNMSLNPKTKLHIDWCSFDAAKYAVLNWHYSKTMPAGKLVKIGVWEEDKFIGCVLFGRGANNNIGKPYGLKQTEICELVRVALKNHKTPVSRIVSIAIKFLKGSSPGIRMIISYADPTEGHHGGIYQAMGWTYIGKSREQRELIVNGEFMHKRTASALYKTASPEKLSKMGLNVTYGLVEWKYVYLLTLDQKLRDRILPLSKQYPKRLNQAMSDFPLEQRQCNSDPDAPEVKTEL